MIERVSNGRKRAKRGIRKESRNKSTEGENVKKPMLF